MRRLAPGLAFCAAFAVFAALFVAAFVSSERCLYFWDQVGVWSKVAQLERDLRDAGLAPVARAVARSVRNDEYNLLAAALLLPAAAIFGTSRLAYELAIVVECALPALALLVALALALRSELGQPSRTFACCAAAATFALVPQIWAPVLVGQPDVAVVAIVLGVLLLARPALATGSFVRAALAGALLALVVVLRRWTVFWAAGFLAGLVARALVEAAPSPVRGRSLARAAAWVAVCAVVAIASLLVVAGPVMVRMAGTDYARAFAAYRVGGGLAASFGALRDHLGAFLPALALAGFGLALRDPRQRGFAVLVATQIAASLLLFLRVQDLDLHHFYLVLPGLIVLALVAILDVGAALDGARRRGLFLLAIVVALAVGFAAMMVPQASSLVALAPFVSSRHGRPLQRGDLPEVERLLRTLDRLTASAARERVYVLSSSVVLNDDLLRWAWLAQPGWPDLGDRLLASHHVDQRDGFPTGLAAARFVVVSDPVGYHLRPADQRVIGLPAEQILAGVGIGRAYRALREEFILDDGVRVTIFERVSDIPEEALSALATEISASHVEREPGSSADREDRRKEDR